MHKLQQKNSIPEEEVSDCAGFAFCRQIVTSSSESEDSWSTAAAANPATIN